MSNRKTARVIKTAEGDVAASFGVESLEDRRMLSGHHAFGGGGFGGFGGGGHGRLGNSVEFDQLPAIIQAGLDALATKDGLTPPDATSTQKVFLGNAHGVETYSMDFQSTGTDTKITVDQNGNPVSAPTRGTTTFGALDTAPAGEISAIATALNLTAPTSTTNVDVMTNSDGSIIYTVRLSSSSSSSSGRWWNRNTVISVDANGNPVGNQTLPFSVIPKVIQDGLNALAPSGATALDPTSTQNVLARTISGITTYSTKFTTSGTTTTVTVNVDGVKTGHSSVQFQTLPAAAQAELQTLATADGVSGTISPTQTIDAFDEGNGTIIYSVTLSASKTGKSGNTFNFNITLAVDQAGNPTVPIFGGGDGGGWGGGGHGFFGGGGDFGGGGGGFNGSPSRRGRH